MLLFILKPFTQHTACNGPAAHWQVLAHGLRPFASQLQMHYSGHCLEWPAAILRMGH